MVFSIPFSNTVLNGLYSNNNNSASAMAQHADPDDPQLLDFIDYLSEAMNIAAARVASPQEQTVLYLLGAIEQIGNKRGLDTTMIFPQSPPESLSLIMEKLVRYCKSKIRELCPKDNNTAERRGIHPRRGIRALDAVPNIRMVSVGSGSSSSSPTLTGDCRTTDTAPRHPDVPSSATHDRRVAPTVTLDDNSRFRLRPKQ